MIPDFISNFGRAADGAQKPRGLRNFQRALLTSCAALAFCPTASVAQNLVLNPGFENSTACAAANWTSVGTCLFSYEYGAFLPHSGINSLAIGNSTGFIPPPTLSQTIAVAAGKYSYSFWYEVYNPGPGASFTAS